MTTQLVMPGIDLQDFGGDAEFWPTPPEAWEPFAPIFLAALPKKPLFILEPAAGRGDLLRMARESVELASSFDERFDVRYGAVEIDQDRAFECVRQNPTAHVVRGDFLTLDLDDTFGDVPGRVSVTNPPFGPAAEFVELSIAWAQPDGVVTMLLPLDFAAGVDRAKRIHDRWPASVYPLRSRPSFGNGQTGQRPVAWFLWDLKNPQREWRCL